MQLTGENWGHARLIGLLSHIFFLLIAFSSFAQQSNLSGVVLDSSNLAPIIDVHVYTRRSGTFTDSEGKFTLFVKANDTLFFSRIGYQSYAIQITSEKAVLKVLLKERGTTLDTLMIYGSIDLKIPRLPEKTEIEGLYKYEKERSYSDNRYIPRHSGPGFSVAAPWYYFSKEQKTKRRINRYRAQNQSTAVYRKLIESDALKAELCLMFKISETEFYGKLAIFAKKFPEASLLKSENEIMELLIQSFATKEK